MPCGPSCARAPEVGVIINAANKTVVEVAKQMRDDAIERAQRKDDDNIKFDSVWCVYDVDDHPLHEAREMAEANGIETAVSNPSFELWLLLHFRDDPGTHHRDNIKSLLKEYDTKYDKHITFELYAEGCEKAILYSKKLDKFAAQISEEGRNPTTGVYKLAELIRGSCPQIQGTWWIGTETERREMLTVRQKGSRVSATCHQHDSANMETRWQLTGQVTNDSKIIGYLEYPAGEGEYRCQGFSGRISQDGNTIEGRAEFGDGGGHDHRWSRIGEASMR